MEKKNDGGPEWGRGAAGNEVKKRGGTKLNGGRTQLRDQAPPGGPGNSFAISPQHRRGGGGEAESLGGG